MFINNLRNIILVISLLLPGIAAQADYVAYSVGENSRGR